jgi:hypothetical protein
VSTDLYQVRVLAVAENRVTCRVTALISGTGEDLPPSRTLALQFLWEPWRWFSEGLSREVSGGTVTPEQAEELGRTAPIGRELAGRDICDGDWTRANVARFIKEVEVYDRVCVPGDSPDESWPTQGIYVITVTDLRWLAHLRPGMEWGTTAYDKDEKD